MDCNRCGKKTPKIMYLVETFYVCEDCNPKARYELGKSKILHIGGK